VASAAAGRTLSVLGASSRVPYGVGRRVFTDQRLLRQIRAEIVGNTMQPRDIAVLENVTLEVLVVLLDERLAADPYSGAQLRQLAASHARFQAVAWRTSRKHPSKLHILDASDIALCGTPVGQERSEIHSGPCLTCAAHAGGRVAAQKNLEAGNVIAKSNYSDS
jgi:hypothetical protein